MRSVSPDTDFVTMEEGVLHTWEKENLFQKQEQLRQNSPEFAFYDGPPFANGLPHYGHLLANAIKDTVSRYWMSRGFKVKRRFGWDCHGLPVEFEIEKREGLKGRPDILKMGVGKFNETCRESVLHYTGEWQKTVTRLGRAVDWNDQYRTMDLEFMESVWWVFGELYRKGLVYQDFKVVPYSPRTSSVVSNFEANQNYKEVQDPSVIVKFKSKEKNEFFLVWTTTPWTLPSNLAIAVGEEILYVRIQDKASGEIWIAAEARLQFVYGLKEDPLALSEEARPFILLEELTSKELVGKGYEPLFSYFKDHENAFQIISASYVTTSDGTGLVHQAPAYGEDDFFACRAHGIKLVDPIDDSGSFTKMAPDYEGLYFKDADKAVCKDLKAKGLLLRHDSFVHSYPFDERTDTPLMYKAVPSWYVAVEKLVPDLVKNNQEIQWVPSHLKDGRMGTWLKNARDWAISRNRFWGTPLPVWVCEEDKQTIRVISSVKELEEKSGETITDLHLHKISHIQFDCPNCSGKLKLVGNVFDCWFESGSMPYAQLHYPFEEQARFDQIFPADFVAEGLDQTRGWFYTLNVLSTALFNKPAFKNVIVNGIILNEHGKKMSKRHRNYTPPEELLGKYGADSVRLYMLNSPLLRADDLCFKDDGVKEITRQVLIPLWNAYSFLSTYANAEKWEPSGGCAKNPAAKNEMDRWILSRLHTLNKAVSEHMQAYELYRVIPRILDFIEDLTNWYIRLNRRRFWGGAGISKESQEEAFSTLYFVMLNFSQTLAPFAPFVSESLYQHLTEGQEGVKESVHLTDMPQFDFDQIDAKLEQDTDLIRKVTNLGRSLRQKHKLKVRQVLPSMLVITRDASDRKAIEHYMQMLKSELNVKEITFTTDEASFVRLQLKPNFVTLGKKLGKQMNPFKQHLERLNQNHVDVVLLLEKLEHEGSFPYEGIPIDSSDIAIDRSPKDERLIASEGNVTILLDTTLTADLIEEGWVREVVNRIQMLRKQSQLQITDRIALEICTKGDLAEAISKHKDYILEETLGISIQVIASGGECTLKFVESCMVDDMSMVVSLEVQQ